jgi:hypothetical protein
MLAAPAPAMKPVSYGTNEPVALVELLSKRIVHGDRDDHRTAPKLRSELSTRDLVLTCGPAVDFVRLELSAAGIRSRAVQLTAPPPHNGFDDGHIMIEVETEHGPVLIDVDHKRLFLIDGKLASLAQVRSRGLDAVELKSFAPARIDPAFSFVDYLQAVVANPRPWYERMLN